MRKILLEKKCNLDLEHRSYYIRILTDECDKASKCWLYAIEEKWTDHQDGHITSIKQIHVKNATRPESMSGRFTVYNNPFNGYIHILSEYKQKCGFWYTFFFCKNDEMVTAIGDAGYGYDQFEAITIICDSSDDEKCVVLRNIREGKYANFSLMADSFNPGENLINNATKFVLVPAD